MTTNAIKPRSATDAALDGLRGLAALIVVASHASQQQLFLLPGLDFSGIGKSGVYLFFVISAYLLTRQWLLMYVRSGPVSRQACPWLQYLLRRVARIYPLYALVLFMAWCLYPRSLGVPVDTTALWRHLALIEGKDLYWSVPVEFKYYLLIPPLAWLLTRPAGAAVKLCGAAAALLALYWAYPPSATPINSSTLGYYLAVFLCGSLAAWLAVRRPTKQAVQSDAPKPRLAVGWLDTCALVILLASIPSLARLVWPSVKPDFLHHAYLPWGIFWSCVILGMLQGKLLLWQRICSTTALRACGRWCFGLYLLHLPALTVARKLPLPDLAQAWAGLALSLLAAALAYRLVERPAMDWASRFGAPSRR